ncbi:unnamed protein product [Arctogadus glacialis]
MQWLGLAMIAEQETSSRIQTNFAADRGTAEEYRTRLDSHKQTLKVKMVTPFGTPGRKRSINQTPRARCRQARPAERAWTATKSRQNTRALDGPQAHQARRLLKAKLRKLQPPPGACHTRPAIYMRSDREPPFPPHLPTREEGGERRRPEGDGK